MHYPNKIEILKFVDHWVGGPICVILGPLHRLTHPFYRIFLRVPLKRDPKTILVIKFFGLGSALLSSSLLRNIKATYPSAKIIVFTFKDNVELIREFQVVDEIRDIDTSNPLTVLFSVFYNLAYFSFHKPDISVDLEYFSKFSTFMSYLSGARWRLGFYIAKFWRNSLVNVPVYLNPTKHILEIYGMFAKAIGADPEILAPLLISSQEDIRFIDKLFSEKGIKKEDFILGVNINSSDLADCRKWPIKKFAEVINSLLVQNKKLKIFLTGSFSEKEYTGSIFKLLKEDVVGRVLDLSGVLDLRQFLALLGKLHLFLTNDSGPFHLAKAQGVTTISIWGPGSPDIYGAYGSEKKKHKVIYKRYLCSPCLYIYRTDAGFFCEGAAQCLEEISVEEVRKAVQDAINEFSVREDFIKE